VARTDRAATGSTGAGAAGGAASKAVTPKKGRPTPTRSGTVPTKPRASAPGRPTPSKRRSGPGASAWIGGARLRTLPLAVAPVAVGVGAATVTTTVSPLLAVLCLVVSVFLQVGVNYANDYSDGIRGTDEFRVGPARLTGSGLVAPKRVLAVALTSFGIAGVAGVVLVVATGLWWLLAVGAVCIVAAWFYTGGKRPYGYNAMGELFVFVFFGLVATAGTAFVLSTHVTQEAWFGGVAVGLVAVAVLVSNNFRDIDTDIKAGKRTLSVLIGRTASRILFVACLLIPFAILAAVSLTYPLGWYVFFTGLIAVPAMIVMLTGRTPADLILVLKLTSAFGFLYGVGLGLALWLS
jgi:1,4-dihydroxy-2-naphthoate polyprenyltransferase